MQVIITSLDCLLKMAIPVHAIFEIT
uniref:Uncharacterized protein n=1 Tax=Vitis vinifera TaxID=29760 RepID=F6HBW8_VITVI